MPPVSEGEELIQTNQNNKGEKTMSKTRIGLFFSVIIGTALLLAACNGGKTDIAIGPPASETNSLSKVLFEAYGIEDDDYKEFQEGFGDAADEVQDGNIDISIGILGMPAGNIEDLQASTGDAKLLALSDDAIEFMEEESGYERFTIPGGTYEFEDEDVETVAAYAILMGNTDTISEDLAYELAKSMIENADENTHNQAEQMTLDNALNGAEDLPMHPGAAKYYEEEGLDFDNPIADLNVDEEKEEYVLGTGSQGGTYYPLGGEMVNIWNEHIDGASFTNTETGASVENLAAIREGEMDLGMTVHVPANDAMNGEGDFEEGAVENAAFIGHIYPEIVQIITREKTDIDSLDDIKQ